MLINVKNKPLYLHFLDRELRRAENINYSDSNILEYVILSIISSLSFCYIGASILFESNSLFPNSTKLILNLEKFDLVKLIINEHSVEEFIESRKIIYSHAADRYPMYFNEKIEDLWPTTPVFSNSSTTQILRSSFISYLDGSLLTNDVLPKEKFQKNILKKLEKKITREREKAITLDLFLSQKQLKNDELRRNSGRLVSYFYTKRYLELFNGDLLCNLPNLTFYDSLSSDHFCNDYRLIKSILELFCIPNYFFRNNSFQELFFIQLVENELFRYFQVLLFAYIKGLKELVKNEKYLNKINIKKYIKSLFGEIDIEANLDPETFCSRIYAHLCSGISKMSSQHFINAYSETKEKLLSTKKVLIVTTTAMEAKVVINSFEKKGFSPFPISTGRLTFWNFGIIGNSELLMLKISEMGSLKPSGSALSIQEAIDSIKPDYVIMVGIAFGLKRKSQEIGDILVSRELQNYESQKKKENIVVSRGHRIPAGATLLDRFDNSSLRFNKVDIELGFMISGDVLSDDKEFVDELISIFPEAIGSEMEGTGLQSSCHREGIEWILIKGICDWGFNKQNQNKQENQKIAIKNVCEYLIFTLINYEL